jgi:peptidoglycan/xylan/chitin deacetylase (PgdA/CDA1 family)
MTTRLRQLVRHARGRSGAEAAPPAGPQDPVVSLTFDDGLASHRIAAEMLGERGLAGTFYVPSGSVGNEGSLGWDDLRALAAQGHEIGGHTCGHSHLTALTVPEARREIEADRLALLEHELDPTTFAYPFGESNAEVESIAREVGYTAARGVGGFVETLPPENVFRLRTPHSARTWTTAEVLKALVVAGAHESGWTILPFHHVEEEGRVASSYTTDPSHFAEFLDWLVAQNVRVMRVCDAVAPGRPAAG